MGRSEVRSVQIQTLGFGRQQRLSALVPDQCAGFAILHILEREQGS
jgi:hypothetical protein